jgi:hypothetical protein
LEELTDQGTQDWEDVRMCQDGHLRRKKKMYNLGRERERYTDKCTVTDVCDTDRYTTRSSKKKSYGHLRYHSLLSETG